MFEQNLNNIISLCNKNANYRQKLAKLNSTIFELFPALNSELELRFNYNIQDIKHIKKMQDFLYLFIAKLLNENSNSIEIEEEYKEDANQIILIIYNFLLGNIDLRNSKYSIYLELFHINFEDFINLSFTTVLELCELKLSGIDVSRFNGFGNYQIDFAYEVTTGKLIGESLLKIKGDIVSNIDACFDTGSTEMIDYGCCCYIFEKDDNYVSIYSDKDVQKPIAVCNMDNEFLIGNFDTILKPFIQIQSTPTKLYGLDDLISSNTEKKSPSVESTANLINIINKLQNNN